MAGFSDYLENKVLAYVFSGTAFSQPGTKYVALFTVAPGEDEQAVLNVLVQATQGNQ